MHGEFSFSSFLHGLTLAIVAMFLGWSINTPESVVAVVDNVSSWPIGWKLVVSAPAFAAAFVAFQFARLCFTDGTGYLRIIVAFASSGTFVGAVIVALALWQTDTVTALVALIYRTAENGMMQFVLSALTILIACFAIAGFIGYFWTPMFPSVTAARDENPHTRLVAVCVSIKRHEQWYWVWIALTLTTLSALSIAQEVAGFRIPASAWIAVTLALCSCMPLLAVLASTPRAAVR
ncbi:MAG: hypothetical protein WA021_00415 [Minisyncoccia bacterium]